MFFSFSFLQFTFFFSPKSIKTRQVSDLRRWIPRLRLQFPRPHLCFLSQFEFCWNSREEIDYMNEFKVEKERKKEKEQRFCRTDGRERWGGGGGNAQRSNVWKARAWWWGSKETKSSLHANCLPSFHHHPHPPFTRITNAKPPFWGRPFIRVSAPCNTLRLLASPPCLPACLPFPVLPNF